MGEIEESESAAKRAFWERPYAVRTPQEYYKGPRTEVDNIEKNRNRKEYHNEH